MEIIFAIIASWIVFAPNSQQNIVEKNKFQINFEEYHQDLRLDAIQHSIPNIYIEKLDNILYRIVDEENDVAFMERYFYMLVDNQKSSVLAMCDHSSNIIYFRAKTLTNKSKYQVQETFDHEVGHCAFGRIHSNSEMDFEGYSLPKSIMNDSIIVDEDNVGAIYIVDHYRYDALKKIYRNELLNFERFDEEEKLNQYRIKLYGKKMSLKMKNILLERFRQQLLSR